MAKRHLNPHKGSSQRWTKQVVLFVFHYVPERRTPYFFSTALISSFFVSVKTSGKWEEWEEVKVKASLPQNFKRGFNGDYGVKLTPDKLRTFCEID
jgi:hypothetical protein